MTSHIIDSNVFIHGSARKIPFENLLTVPGVTAELESADARNRFENEDISIREPDEESVRKVKKTVKELGSEVSETDISLVALTMEVDGILVTDDYHMQNLSERIGIRWEGFLKEGIDEGLEWERVCRNCGRKSEGEKCSFCGSETFVKSR